VRAWIAASISGALAGAVVATIAGRILAPAPKPTAASGPRVVDAPVMVPSSWDTRFLPRLEAVESKVALLSAGRPNTDASDGEHSTDTKVAGDNGERAAALEQQYELDLAHQDHVLFEHQHEPADREWARAQEQEIGRVLSEASDHGGGFRVESVDCRSKTCVAEITYPSPGDALSKRNNLSSISAKGCHGMSSALERPTSAGAYTARIIYYCR
jgi:hypothetical protein